MSFICTLASGSSGNAALLSDGETHILIDAGISLKALTEGLKQFDLRPADLSAVLLTHEHTDHTKGLGMLCKKAGKPVYLSYGTAGRLEKSIPALGALANVYSAGSVFEIGRIGVETFSTPHDAAESVGFAFHSNGRKLGYVTDLGHVTERMRGILLGAECLFVESNHDIFTLLGGPYPDFLKQRILGRRGHLSNDDCADFALEAVQKGARNVTLCHLSQQNNSPGAASFRTVETLERAGCGATEAAGMVFVAPVDTVGVPYIF